jgi:hypothetical protein
MLCKVVEGEKSMLKEILEVKREKARVFQVLLLNNDASQDVELQEAEEVDFLRVQDHLKQGGSVFITSKNSQKLKVPMEKERIYRNTNEMKTITAFYFDHI